MKKIIATSAILTLSLGLFSLSLGSASAVVHAPIAKSIRMPSLLGMVDGQLRWQLSTKGYKFSVAMTKSYPGYNTKLSCLMSGRNYIVKQSPAVGSTVANSTSTVVTVWVNCG
jgi:hypothetical protein